MSTITAILEPDADGTLHLPLPAEWRNHPIRVTANLEPVTAPPEQLRGFGCLRGQIWISQDFNEPLEDFREYME